MAAQIILEVVPDLSKVKTGLDTLTAEGGGDAAVFKAGNAELEKRSALLGLVEKGVQNVDKAEQKTLASIGQVTKGVNSMATAVVKITGSEFNKMMQESGMSVDELAASLAGATEEVIDLDNAEKKEKKTKDEGKKSTDADIAATMSLKAQKRQLTEEIGRLIVAGQQNSKEFRTLVARAGELDDAMGDATDAIRRTGSDTKGIDNAVLAMSGLAATVGGATAVMGLFGNESEDVQKIMLKVMQVTQLLNSVQEIQNLLKSEYVKTLLASITATTANTTATAAEVVVVEGQAVATTEAAAAQTALNVAMLANPVLLVVAALAAIVTAIVLYTNSTNDAEEAQERLNRAIDSAPLEKYNTALDRSLTLLQKQLELRGAKASEIAAEEFKVLEQKKDAANAELDRLSALAFKRGTTDKEFQALQKRAFEVQLQRDDLQFQMTIKNFDIAISKKAEQKAADAEAAQASEKAQAAADKATEKRTKAAEKRAADEKARLEDLREIAIRGSAEIAAIQIQHYKEVSAEQQKMVDDELKRQQKLADDIEAVMNASINSRLAGFNRASQDATKSDQQRFEASQELHQQELNQINAAQVANTGALLTKAISFEEFTANDIALTQQAEDKKAEIVNAAEDRKKAIRQAAAQAAIGIAQQVSDAIFEMDRQHREQELQEQLAALDKSKEQALNTKNLTEAQKAATQEKYDKEAARLKTEAAKKERKAQTIQALVNTALAVINAFATAPWPLSIIMAAAAFAAGMVQVAKINSAPLPQYAKGGKNVPAGFAVVGEQGPEIIQLKGGETIFTNPQSEELMKAWNSGKAEREFAYNLPDNWGSSIDYDRLGKAVAKHLPDTPVVNMVADEHGLTLFMQSQNAKTTIRNKRYSTK